MPGPQNEIRNPLSDIPRYSIPKSDIHLENYERNSFYTSDRGLESYNSTPNNFDIRVDNFNQRNLGTCGTSEHNRT